MAKVKCNMNDCIHYTKEGCLSETIDLYIDYEDSSCREYKQSEKSFLNEFKVINEDEYYQIVVLNYTIDMGRLFKYCENNLKNKPNILDLTIKNGSKNYERYVYINGNTYIKLLENNELNIDIKRLKENSCNTIRENDSYGVLTSIQERMIKNGIII